jgi:hypothetical protein
MVQVLRAVLLLQRHVQRLGHSHLKWVATTIPCKRPAANTWQHLMVQTEINNGKAVSIAHGEWRDTRDQQVVLSQERDEFL